MNKQQEPRLRFKGFAGEWQRATIGELGEIVTGNTPTTSENDNYGNNGLLWVTPTDIKEPITIKTAKQLSEKGKKSARCLPPNSILITCIASIGKNTLIETYGSCNQQINALIPKKECNPYFLLTLSELWSIQMKKIAGSGTMDIVNKTQFSEIRTKLPSSEEQSTIGNFFRRLDSQIAENRAVLEKSRQLKKAMLAKMFPANGEKIPKIRFKGFEGEWECRKLGIEVEIIGGGTPDTTNSTYWNGDIDWYSPTEIGEAAYANGSVKKITLLGLQKSSAQILPANRTVLFTSRASIGDMAILTKDGATNQGFQSFVVGERLDVYFLYTMGFKIKDYALKNASGSTFLEISKNTLSQMEFFAPSLKEQTAIGLFFRQLDETIALQSAEVEKLNQLKKGLLAAMLV